MLNTVVQHSIVGQHAFQVQVDPLEKSGPEAVWTFSGFYLSPKRSIRSGEVFFLRWSICVGKLALVACGTPLARDILTKRHVGHVGHVGHRSTVALLGECEPHRSWTWARGWLLVAENQRATAFDQGGARSCSWLYTPVRTQMQMCISWNS